MFKINWPNRIIDLLPAAVRTEFNRDWLLLCAFKIRQIWDSFLVYRTDNLVKASLTGQIMTLEEHLNDVFDPVNREIHIEDPEWIEPVNLFLKVEEKPRTVLYLKSEAGAPTYLWNQEEADYVQFIVYIPTAWADSIIEEMKTIINCYKLAGKQYQIIVE